MTHRFLVLGANGMLGSSCLRVLAESGSEVWGTVRSASGMKLFPQATQQYLVSSVDAGDIDSVAKAFALAQPNIVVNCIGVVKQLSGSKDPFTVLPINSLFPHRLARLCAIGGARLIHVSTDCVFSGERGLYREDDRPDADDLYGISKRLGELDYPHAITLRTSIIGHELQGARSLIDWFLSQKGEVEGFTKAVFSGLPTVELARVIKEQVVPRPEMSGLYHVSSEPIDKFALLCLVAETYGLATLVRPSETLVIDRSLDSTRFRSATGWEPPSWAELVARMYRDFRQLRGGSTP